MGFDKDQVIGIQNPYGFGTDPQNTYRLSDLMKHYVSSEPALENITTTWFPFQGYNTNGHIINGKKTSVEDFNIDYKVAKQRHT